jgi:hypothetical protein
MAAFDGGTLALLFLLGAGAIALILVGVANLRSGRRGLPPDLVLAWHQQPRTLFGINNIVFACLLIFILLLILLSAPALRPILIALVALMFLTSLVLLVFSMMASLRLPTVLREHARRTREDGE